MSPGVTSPPPMLTTSSTSVRSSTTPGTCCGSSAAGPTQAMRSSWSRIAALVSISVPDQSRPMLVRRVTDMCSPRSGPGTGGPAGYGQSAGRHGDLVSGERSGGAGVSGLRLVGAHRATADLCQNRSPFSEFVYTFLWIEKRVFRDISRTNSQGGGTHACPLTWAENTNGPGEMLFPGPVHMHPASGGAGCVRAELGSQEFGHERVDIGTVLGVLLLEDPPLLVCLGDEVAPGVGH